ncbi:hypothetical protein HB435_002604 [Salmonella enterica subsp. enterica serovar Stanley]|nr:hypothetical protein [Salmonella enterica subsp. enterica serovar Stanley]
MTDVQSEVKMIADTKNSYLDRNDKWIRPMLIAFMFAFGTFSSDIFGFDSPVVTAVSMTVATIAFIISGVGLMFTNTISAKIIKMLTILLLFLSLIILIIRLFT